MNKLFTKIATLGIGLAMAIGVGVAVASNKDVAPVYASPSSSDTLTVLTSSSTIDSDADYVLKSPLDGTFFTGTVSSKWGALGAITSADTFTLSGTPSNFTAYSNANSNYLTYTKGSVTFGSTATNLKIGSLTVSGTAYNGLQVYEQSYTMKSNGSSGLRWYDNATVSTSMKPVEFYKVTPAATAATINGANSVDVNGTWTPTSITEDVGGATVSGGDLTYAFATSGGATISNQNTSTGSFTATSAGTNGTVTVSATKTGYTIASKVVNVNSADPYINLTLTSSSEPYTGQTISISSEYGNGVAGLNWTVESGTITEITKSNSGFSGTLVSSGTVIVRATDTGSALYKEVSVNVTASSVTIEGMPSTGSLTVGGTLNLGSLITVTAVGSYSNSVTWESDDEDVATVTSSGVVTGEGLGTTDITVTSVSDPTVSETCTITVALMHTYTFGTTFNSTACNDIDTVHSFDPACFSGETTLYGSTSTSGIRMGSGSATGSFVYTLPDSGAYITRVTLTMKAWSSSESSKVSVTPTGGTAVVKAFSDYSNFVDYNYDIPSTGEYSSVTISTDSTNKRAYVSAMSVQYAYKTPEITSSANNFELAKSASQNLTLTFSNYATTPTVTYSVTSGASSVSSVTGYNSITNNQATVIITASATTGDDVTIRFTATASTQTAYIDIVFDVIAPKTITDLEITTAGTTVFTEDDEFVAGPLVLTATFSDLSTVVYSAANENLGLLTFDPALGTALATSDTSVTVYVTAYGDDVFQMYDITVNEKPYAAKVTTVDNLWDGQQVYFGNQDETYAGGLHTGGNNMSAQAATIDSSKGLSINDSTAAHAYTIERVDLSGTTYYMFSFDVSGTKYYLTDTGTSNNNYMGRTTTISDTSTSCVYFSISIDDGVASITSKSNTNKPSLRWNSGSSIFACYSSSGSQTDPVLFAATAYSAGAVAESFQENRMHMTDYTSSEGWCADEEHHYYDDAKQVWNAMETSERSAVSAEAKARLAAWASANGDTFDGGTGALASARILPTIIDGNNRSAVSIIVIISLVSLTAVGGYFLLKKKKEQ